MLAGPERGGYPSHAASEEGKQSSKPYAHTHAPQKMTVTGTEASSSHSRDAGAGGEISMEHLKLLLETELISLTLNGFFF